MVFILIMRCTEDAFDKNIASEVEAGKPRAQAVAIAASTLRASCKQEGKQVPAALQRFAKEPTS